MEAKVVYLDKPTQELPIESNLAQELEVEANSTQELIIKTIEV
jgi:hypothetical protein